MSQVCKVREKLANRWPALPSPCILSPTGEEEDAFMPEPGNGGRRYSCSAIILTRGKLPPNFEAQVDAFAARVADVVEDELNPQLQEWTEGYNGDAICLCRIFVPLPMEGYHITIRLFTAVIADVEHDEFYEVLMEKFLAPAVGVALDIFGEPRPRQRVFSVSLDGETEQAFAPFSFFEQSRADSGLHLH